MRWRRVVPLDIETETDSGDYRATLDRCLAEFDWTEKVALQGRLIDGRYHGVAVGCYFEGGGSGPRENVRLELETDGSVSVYVGSSSVGQGVETVFAQIAADALERPMTAHPRRAITARPTTCRQGFGSYSSRSIVMGGSAIVAAAATLEGQDQGARRRSIFDCGAQRHRARRRHGDRPRPTVSIAVGRARRRRPLGRGHLRQQQAHLQLRRARRACGGRSRRPGRSNCSTIVAVEDVGRIINPLTLHGQTRRRDRAGARRRAAGALRL